MHSIEWNIHGSGRMDLEERTEWKNRMEVKIRMEKQNGNENQNGKISKWQTPMDDPSGLPQPTAVHGN